MIYGFKRILVEKDAKDYEMTNKILETAKKNTIPIFYLNSNRNTTARGMSKKEKYFHGKESLVVSLRKTLKFQTCKPSAHYQLPLVSGCIGQCEYCYLNTQFSNSPFVKVYVNLDDIFLQAKKHIDKNSEVTIFEGAATSDPIPVESYSHSLQHAIDFFANEKNGRFRFVTKYNDVDHFLDIKHNNHTEIRFSVNIARIIQEYEHKTPALSKRLEAAAKLLEKGYPVGFIIGPVILGDHWKEEYNELIYEMNSFLKQFNKLENRIYFEIISHRYTTRAKNTILEIFDQSTLPMNEEERMYKYGQFGYGKYVYPKEQMEEIKTFFEKELSTLAVPYEIKYII